MKRMNWNRVGCALSLAVSLGCSSGLPEENKRDAAAESDEVVAETDAGARSAQDDVSDEGTDGGVVDAKAGSAPMTDAAASASSDASPGATDGQTAQPGADAATADGSADAEASTVTPGRVCAPDTLFEPNDSSGNPCWINPNMKIASGISGTDKDDYFSIEVEKGMTYTVDLFRTGNVNFEMTLQVGTVTEQLQRSAFLGGVGPWHAEVTPSTSGRAVMHINNGAADYRLAVWNSHVTRDAQLEPNNGPSTAAPVALGAEIASELGALPDDDIDYFTVPVKANTVYVLHLEHSAPVDRGVSMVGSNSTLVPNAYLLASPEEQVFTPATDGLALVMIRRPATYKFSVFAR